LRRSGHRATKLAQLEEGVGTVGKSTAAVSVGRSVPAGQGVDETLIWRSKRTGMLPRLAFPNRLALVAACCLSACSLVQEGPQVTEAPEDFGFTTSISSARKPLPHRSAIRQMGYLGPPGEPPDMIIITEYEGAAPREEAEAARDELAGRDKSESYGPFESTSVARRVAWRWSERQQSNGKLWSHEEVVVVPWGEKTYSVEYSAHGERIDPARQQRVVRSFRVVTRGATDLFVYLGLAAAALALGWAIHRMQKARPR
jgi:hypothetical protein